MDNNQQLKNLIKKFSSNHILSCELSLYLLDLQRNYSNYKCNSEYNGDRKEDTFDKELLQLKQVKLNTTYTQIENYIMLCYVYFLKKEESNSEKNYDLLNIGENDLKKIEELLKGTIYQDFKNLVCATYIDHDLQQNKQDLDKMISSTCMFMSCYLSNDEYSKQIKEVIKEIHSNSHGKLGKLQRKISLDNKTLCSCFVRNNKGNNDYFIFSGGWDNPNYPNGSKILGRYLEAEDIINKATKSVFQTHDKDVVWCKREGNMRSYEFRCFGRKHAKLERIFKRFKVKREDCINKHFSCCERKALALFENDKEIDSELYVTFNPCTDCKLALYEFVKEDNRKIKVYYEINNNTPSHYNSCNLYNLKK